ncbi:MAG: hypothetical protein ABIN37_10730 [Burkholderiaceae bacterium]
MSRVTSAHYFTRLGVVPLTILMNRKKFDSLPKASQDIIRKYSGDWTAARFNENVGAYNDTVIVAPVQVSGAIHFVPGIGLFHP